MLKSKVHRVHVTQLSIDYEGSIAVDRRLMEEADILPYEQVHVLNVNNGARFTTYAIEGASGEICLNGPAARLAVEGDTIVILSYCHVEDDQAGDVMPKLVYVDAQNAVTETTRAVKAIPF
jgi:aspartate 1-decarboxylase